jgi:arginine/lysine/ornithine decarboxylase
LWNEAIRTAVETRKILRRLGRELAESAATAEEKWFFDPFVPDVVTIDGSAHHPDCEGVRWEDIPTEVLLLEKQCWQMRKGAAWHGYTHIEDGYAMVDPCKLALVTPGFDRASGAYLDWGVPANVLAVYLRERGIVPEKNDLNTILFLVTPGIETSKAGSLIAALVAFKRLVDRNAPLSEALPAFTRKHSAHYSETRLRDLCVAMHGFYRQHDCSGLQRQNSSASIKFDPCFRFPDSIVYGIRKSVGFGFRWFSPIGPLRFEWGFPLRTLDAAPDPVVFEFSIGSPF